jgi:hypothetical protein
MTFTHLNLWFDSRASPYIKNSSPVNNPNTDLSEVPREAKIHFEHGSTRELSVSKFESLDCGGDKVRRFLIERALLDPDATVVPL